jgi:hypothetical protein
VRPIESNQGQKSRVSAIVTLSIWNVACVMYPNMTIVTLGTTI